MLDNFRMNIKSKFRNAVMPVIRKPLMDSLFQQYVRDYHFLFNTVNKTAGHYGFFRQAQDNPYVYSCVNAISDTFLINGFKINNPDEFHVNINNVRYLTNLFNSPEANESSLTFPVFIKQIVNSQELVGDTFIEVNYEEFDYDHNNYHIINGLQYVPASLLRWFDDTAQYGFRNKPNIRYEPEELIHIYEPTIDFKDSKFGESKLEKIQKPLLMMWLGLDYNQKLMENEGIDPTAILSFDKDIDNDEFNAELLRLQAMIQSQVNKNGGMLAVKGASYQSANMNNKDMDYVNMMNMCRDMIISLFRVPPAMIGVIETANLGSGNGEAQKEQFKNVMNAKAKFYEAAFNKALGSNGFDEVFEFNEMDIEDELKRANIESTQIRDGIRTVNEIRKTYGWNPVEWGNEPLGYGQSGVNQILTNPVDAKSLQLENKNLSKALLMERLRKEYK